MILIKRSVVKIENDRKKSLCLAHFFEKNTMTFELICDGPSCSGPTIKGQEHDYILFL